MPDSPGDITLLLAQLRDGDPAAESRLMPLVYSELRKLARRYMRNERADHTLQPTALVHEAYLRMLGQHKVSWQNRAHFFGVAAGMMRHILVDYARARAAGKRGGSDRKVSLDDNLAFAEDQATEVIALDQALNRLSVKDPRQCRIVELRFFGGLNEEETAGVLGISTRTVKRDWSVARAWLYKEIGKGPGGVHKPPRAFVTSSTHGAS